METFKEIKYRPYTPCNIRCPIGGVPQGADIYLRISTYKTCDQIQVIYMEWASYYWCLSVAISFGFRTSGDPLGSSAGFWGGHTTHKPRDTIIAVHTPRGYNGSDDEWCWPEDSEEGTLLCPLDQLLFEVRSPSDPEEVFTNDSFSWFRIDNWPHQQTTTSSLWETPRMGPGHSHGGDSPWKRTICKLPTSTKKQEKKKESN